MNEPEPNRSAGPPAVLKRWRHPLLALATGFGLGLSPIASGTTGALLGLPVAWWLSAAPIAWQIAVALILSFLAVPVCEGAERLLGGKDDGRIVADEYLTFAVCVIGIPLRAHPWMLAVAFVINRVFDVIKPPPARGLQSLHGGVGIVIDDFLACLYALAVNHGLAFILPPLVSGMLAAF